MSAPRPLPRKGQAFSMIEVVLALGIVSFALTSLFGLFSVTLGLDRQAAADGVLSAMTEFVSSTLSAQKFANLTNTPYYFAFDADGRCLQATTNAGSAPAGAFYTCVASGHTGPALLQAANLATNNACVFSVSFASPGATNTLSLAVTSYD